MSAIQSPARWAGAAASLSFEGIAPWTNPGNATGPNDTVLATVSVPVFNGGDTNVLRLTNFGFTAADVPDGAINIWPVVTFWRKAATTSRVRDRTFQLIHGSAGNASDRIGVNAATGGTFTTSLSSSFRGSTVSDSFQANLTPAMIRDANFGVDLVLWSSQPSEIIASIDAMQMYFTYDLASTVKPRRQARFL